MSDLNYSQCWEDSEQLKKALQLKPEDVVLSVTSGGDNTLALLLTGVAGVTAVDMTASQNLLAEIKLKAPQVVSYDEYVQFLGVTPSGNRVGLQKKLQLVLSASAWQWLEQNPMLVQEGLIHSGKFERYLNRFRTRVLPLIHSNNTVKAFLNCKDLAEQLSFYKQTWNTNRWRLAFWVASHTSLVKKFARQRGVRDVVSTDGPSYGERLEYILQRNLLKDNFYLQYALLGTYNTAQPEYLTMQAYELLRSGCYGEIDFVTADLYTLLSTAPTECYSKFNLSDVFEFMSDEAATQLWQEIVRTAKPGAIIVYWCNRQEVTPPESLHETVLPDSTRAAALHELDRLYFYRSFHVYTIKK